MINMLRKEIRLSASPLAFLFILFGLMFLIPGYPILCGVFFVTLGLYHSFQNAREANDVVFTALLPVSKRDVVKGRYLFICMIETLAWLLMCLVTGIRMTVLADSAVYRTNVLMNANPFALGMALIIFGLFNWIFVGGFFKTAYAIGKPFVIYIIVCFTTIGIAETLHHIPGCEWLNAFGTAFLPNQMAMLATGIAVFTAMTMLSFNHACHNFEIIDL